MRRPTCTLLTDLCILTASRLSQLTRTGIDDIVAASSTLHQLLFSAEAVYDQTEN